MRKSHYLCISVIFFLFFTAKVSAQDKVPIKFGKVGLQDFDVNYQAIDSSADAVVVADVGTSVFEGNTKGWFSIKFQRKTRIKIINRNGLDAANIEIPLYTDGNSEEKLSGLKAYTYNIEGGKVIETKLDGGSVFKDKISKKLVVQKFTMPAAKEGSIVEFSYTVTSDFIFNLQPWEFQGKYPRLWSEYEVEIPEYFRYVFLSQGSKDFFIKKSSDAFGNWSVLVGANSTSSSQMIPLSGTITVNRWVMKDIVSIKEESFTSSIDNYITKVQFQMASIQLPNRPVEYVMNNWEKTAEDMMKDEQFGEGLYRANNWLDDEMKMITAGLTSKLDKAHAVYNFVKNNFTNSTGNGMWARNTLKSVFKSKNGNVAEINLLLTAMLQHEDIDAKPVILSTKSHGYTNEMYPILERYNYVVSLLEIEGNRYYLDAANPTLGFGVMHWKCYNGHARVIEKNTATPVYFDADSLRETKMTSVFIINNNNKWAGTYNSTPGMYESISLKEDIKEKGQEAYFKKISAGFGTDMSISNTAVDSLNADSKPVTIHYDFELKNAGEEDIIYFNPMMGDIYKENPFKSAERHYPVEMPYAMDDVYIANIEVPKGYEVDELPKSARVNFNETEGMFEYMVGRDGENIQLRCRIKLAKAFFQPDDYESLREFFGYIVKKQSEQIVFKKKK